MRILCTPKLFRLSATLFFICMGLFFVSASADARTVRLGVYNFMPLVGVGTYGEGEGLYVDVFRHVAEQEKWTVEVVPGSWDENLDRLESGEIDILASIASSPERARNFLFSESFLFLDWGVVYQRPGGTISTIFDLDGRKIAALKGSVYTQGFKLLADQFGIYVEIVEKNEYAEVFEAISNEEVDAGINAKLNGAILGSKFNVERTQVFFSPVKIRFAARQGGAFDILETLDTYTDAMKADPESYYYDRLKRWVDQYVTEIEIFPSWLSGAIISLVFFIGGLVLFNWVLQRQIHNRTVNLLNEISERRKIEEKLRVTLNSIGDAVIATDIFGRITSINPVAERLCGFKKNEAVGVHMDNIFHVVNSHTREPAINPAHTVFVKGATVGLANHTILVSRDGTEYQIADSAAPIRNEAGEVLGIVLVFRDVTEEYAVREDLNNALVNAERANQAKSEFLASMSHELRTPLNAIIGFAQMLQLSPSAPLTLDQNENVNCILQGGNHLLNLVNDILDLACIEANQINFLLSDFEARDVISHSVQLMAPLGVKHNVEIIDNYSNGPSALLFSDRTRLKQVLINLLSNAIRFNKDGGRVTVEGTETDYDYLRISVIDTGIGIAKEYQSSIFNLFQRVGADPLVARDGTGIGLTVTRSLMESLAGHVGFKSEEGVGSTFWIEIPLATNDNVLIWTEAIKTDVDLLDKDHQILISMLNRLMRKSADEEDVDEVISDLMEYTQYHFSREEVIMDVCGYSGYERHCDYHRKLIDKLNQHCEVWRKERNQESIAVFRKFLKDWLFNHILKEDTKIAYSARGKVREIRRELEAVGLMRWPPACSKDN